MGWSCQRVVAVAPVIAPRRLVRYEKHSFPRRLLRRDSLNMRLARVAAQNLPEGFEATFFDLQDVPMYNDDLRGELSPRAYSACARPCAALTASFGQHRSTTMRCRGL